MNANEIKKLLDYHDNLYYNQDSPEISDFEYDALKARYLELTGLEEYDYVPGEASETSVKYQHTTNISSLDKCQITEVDELKSHIHRLWPVTIQPKMDGLTLVSYPSGEHVTRGNGEIGEVVTLKVTNVDGIGEFSNVQVPIRSEVVMLKSEFNKLNEEKIKNGEKPFDNTRNAAAGMLRQLDINKVKGLKAFAYNIIRTEESNDSSNQIMSLQMLGWNTVDNFKPETEEEALDYILTYEDKYRDSLDYDIDGLVIKHDGSKKFGFTRHHPNGAIAVKFEAQGEWTTLKSVTWQVGKTGK